MILKATEVITTEITVGSSRRPHKLIYRLSDPSRNRPACKGHTIYPPTKLPKNSAETRDFPGFPLPPVGRTDLIGVRFEVNALRPENFVGFSDFFLEPLNGTCSGSMTVWFRRAGYSKRLSARRPAAKPLKCLVRDSRSGREVGTGCRCATTIFAFRF